VWAARTRQPRAVGTPREIYEDPVSSHVARAGFRRRINLVPRSALGDNGRTADASDGGIPVEHLRLDDANGTRTGPAARARTAHRTLSDQRLVHVALDGSDTNSSPLHPQTSLSSPARGGPASAAAAVVRRPGKHSRSEPAAPFISGIHNTPPYPCCHATLIEHVAN